MARRIYQGVMADGNGSAIPGATVTVYLTGTTTAATIYESSTGSVISGAAVTTNTVGYFSFWIDEDDYTSEQMFDLSLSKTNYATKTYDNVNLLSVAHYVSYNLGLANSLNTDIQARLSNKVYISCDYDGDLALAVSDIGSTPTVLVIDTAVVIASGTTITTPQTLALEFIRSGSIDGISGGGTETLVVNGQIIAGDWQIFGENLTVTFGDHPPIIKPQYWGAIADDATHDDTTALKNMFSAIVDYQTVIIPSGQYLYTPDLSLAAHYTGEGYLNLIAKTGVHIEGYGATIYQSTEVQTVYYAANVSGVTVNSGIYGVTLAKCDGCTVEGLTVDGHRDLTYTEANRESYSGFGVYGGSNNKLINCIGKNCQGDGLTTNRGDATSNFCLDLKVIGCTFKDNARNQSSIGGNFDTLLTDCHIEGKNAGDTAPQAGIDVEWEHATTAPLKNCNIRLDNNTFYNLSLCVAVTRTYGVDITNNNMSLFTTAGASIAGNGINVSGTSSISSRNITIQGNSIDTAFNGVLSEDYTENVFIDDNTIKSPLPIFINSSIATSYFTVKNNKTIGEGTYGVKYWNGGFADISNNTFINPASGTGKYMALFGANASVCNNTFIRNSAQTIPDFGIVFLSSNIDFNDNIFETASWTTDEFIFNHNGGAALSPKLKSNVWNSSPQPEWGYAEIIPSSTFDSAVSSAQAVYVPVSTKYIYVTNWKTGPDGVAGAGSATIKIGTTADDDAYVTSTAGWNPNAVGNLSANATGTAFTNNTAVFVTITVTATGKSRLLWEFVPYASAAKATTATVFTSSSTAP